MLLSNYSHSNSTCLSPITIFATPRVYLQLRSVLLSKLLSRLLSLHLSIRRHAPLSASPLKHLFALPFALFAKSLSMLLFALLSVLPSNCSPYYSPIALLITLQVTPLKLFDL